MQSRPGYRGHRAVFGGRGPRSCSRNRDFYDFPLFYIEYSGQFGETADVHAAATALDETRLLYGGGIDSAQKATQVLDAGTDAVVVGDCFHEDSKAYLKTTQVQ